MRSPRLAKGTLFNGAIIVYSVLLWRESGGGAHAIRQEGDARATARENALSGPSPRTDVLERLLSLPTDARDSYMSTRRPFGAQLEYELRSRREQESRRKRTRVLGTLFVASVVLSLILLALA